MARKPIASWQFLHIFILSTESIGQPTLPLLLNFPGKKEKINIPERIGTHQKTFGIILLKDENGAKIETIAKEKDMNLTILSRWLQGDGMQPPTWSTLIEALNNSNLGVLAKEIRTAIEP